jgi:hypothetical protein
MEKGVWYGPLVRYYRTIQIRVVLAYRGLSSYLGHLLDLVQGALNCRQSEPAS